MRQLVADKNLDKDGCLVIEGKKFRYMNSVLRVKSGDMVHVRLPSGSLQPMTVAGIDSSAKKIILQAAFSVIEDKGVKALPSEFAPELEITLFLFVSKPPKMELAVRQAVECGVKRIVPVEGVFCQKGSIEAAKKKSSGKDDRWQRIINEAREQSGSAVATEVTQVMSLEEALDFWQEISGSSPAFVLYERSEDTKNFREAAKESGGAEKVALAVGAEGGISPEEISLMKSRGFTAIHLETNILRCETAALYGIAAVQTIFCREENLSDHRG